MKILRFFVSIAVCLSAGAIGSVFTYQNIPTWYQTLNKPAFSPPNWIFAPVWTLLYILMGISLYIIWEKGFKENKLPIILFLSQLILNAKWSFLFFGMRSPLYGLIGIIFLWAFILATIISFYKISKTAALLLIPYILWVSFASFLNFYILILN